MLLCLVSFRTKLQSLNETNQLGERFKWKYACVGMSFQPIMPGKLMINSFDKWGYSVVRDHTHLSKVSVIPRQLISSFFLANLLVFDLNKCHT